MNKQEFIIYILSEYSAFDRHMTFELLENVLDYADGMNPEEQYNFLCRMIPQVPEKVIRTVSY